MTGIAKPHVSRAVNDLIAAGVVRRSAGTFGNSLSINKRYKQWALGALVTWLPNQSRRGYRKSNRGYQNSNPLMGLPKRQPRLLIR